jgi:hypothetical protein
MAQGTLINTYVFVVFFAAGFVIAGKRPILTLSTRLVLLALIASAIGYVVSGESPWHSIIGAATLILNCVFIGFALIDYVNWNKKRTS